MVLSAATETVAFMLPTAAELAALLTRDPSQLILSGVTRELGSNGTWLTTEVHVRPGHLRLEKPPGKLDVLINPDGRWVTRGTLGGEPIQLTADAILCLPRVIDDYNADPDYWSEWLARDPEVVEATVHPTTLHGHNAWKFACPRVKDNTPYVTVDAETGLLLREESDVAGLLTEWVTLDMDPRHNPGLFQL